MNWHINTRNALKQAGLTEPDPSWMRRCWRAGITTEDIVALVAHQTSGQPARTAPLHARLPDATTSEGLQLLSCCCGVESMATRFSRDEQAAWWTQHLEDTRDAIE